MSSIEVPFKCYQSINTEYIIQFIISSPLAMYDELMQYSANSHTKFIALPPHDLYHDHPAS